MPISNWDDLRIFVAIGRAGGIAAAARTLRLDHSTVVRRLAGLEAAMDVRLADRLPTGVRLTPVGQALFAHAERIEAEVRFAAGDSTAPARLAANLLARAPAAITVHFSGPAPLA